MKPSHYLWLALPLLSGIVLSQGSEKHHLPTLVLEAGNRLVPRNTRVRAVISRQSYWDRVETKVGENGRVSLAVKRNDGILRGFRIELFVDLPDSGDRWGKPTFHYASVKLDGRVPTNQVRLQARTASFLGSGRLLDHAGKPSPGVRLEAHIDTTREEPEIDPDDKEDSIVFLGSSQRPFLVGSTTTGPQGEFALWSVIAAEEKDRIHLRCKKPPVLGVACFDFAPGKRGLTLKTPALSPLQLRIKLPSGLPRNAYRIILSKATDNYFRHIPDLRLSQEADRGDPDVWTLRCPPVPSGPYRLDLKPLVDFNSFVTPLQFTHPRKQQDSPQEAADWSREDKVLHLQGQDSKGAPIPGFWVGLHNASWPLSNSGAWYKLDYAIQANAQGRATFDPLHDKTRAVLWSPHHRMKVVVPGKDNHPVVLEETPQIEWRIPKELARPRKDLHLQLRLVPAYGSKSPQPPWQILEVWKRPVPKTGIVRMRIGYPGAMYPWLILENTRTGAIGRMRAWGFGSWHDLDRASKPRILTFDKGFLASLLDQLEIE